MFAPRVLPIVVLSMVSSMPAWSATLTRFELVIDGSTNPPGDRLDITVLFAPGQRELVLETQVFRLAEDPQQPAEPVISKTADHRGPDGRLLIVTRLAADPQRREVKAQVVIPYASLTLSRGMHRLAYEVVGREGARINFRRATDVRYVIVGDTVRREIWRNEELVNAVADKVHLTAVVARDGKIASHEVDIAVQRSVSEYREVSAKVQIPGGFGSPLFAKAMPEVPPPDVKPIEATVVPLEDKAWLPLSDFEPEPKRTILYATNRAVVRPADLSPARFGDTSAGLAYGACVVNIPIENHTRGQLETKTHWWQRRDPRKHFLIERLESFDRDRFLRDVRPGDVLLYIHGYNTTFEYAVLRAAQLVHDLEFPGSGIAFSWPSAGATTGYFHDEEQAAASAGALRHLLQQLVAGSEETASGRRCHVIVHSMGNRVFLAAARQFELDNPGRKIFGHVALAAPDVDAVTFAALVPAVIRQAESTTLYYCQSDRALLASRTIHVDKPVGMSPFFTDGLTTINADNANTSFLGHGYYASAHQLLLDMKLLVLHNLPPDQRLPPLLERTLVLGYPHWAFRAVVP